ncbi:hypothetical protein [Providencia sp. PROV202]|uniref:hypothetical protein n=1 Tax=Providencia sp. PROV202 TaxID=2949902 RepID=UPI0023495EDF|nr:hypothetical protein [Providencia sp. PROV202]
MSKIDIQDDEALVKLLLNADKDDIDLLIDYITNTGKFGFSMSDNVKRVLLDTKLHDEPDEETLRLLVRELQYFGGNTFVNLVRRNGVSYNEIVNDVASHVELKLPTSSSVEEKEALIINAEFTTLWQKIAVDERATILHGMGVTLPNNIENLSGINIPYWQKAMFVANSFAQAIASKELPLTVEFRAKHGIAAALGALVVPMGIPIAGLISASNPAFRVTVPCVVQIAWIRLKNSRQFRLATKSSSTTMPVLNYDQRWGFGSDDNQPALTVSTISLSEMFNTSAMREQNVASISRLSPLLQTLPSLATSSHIANHQYMEVFINGPLANVKDGSGFRGFSLGEKGIKEHAVLLNPDKLNQLVNAGMLLNVASAVLAQKHLADISKKLTEIVDAVREVSAFQNNERKSEITGAIEYLQQISPAVFEEQCLPSVRQKLEDIELQFSAIQAHLLTDITATGNKIIKLENGGFFSSMEITSKVQAQQKILDERIHEWNLAIAVRGQALHLLANSEGNTTLVKQRQQSITHSYQQFKNIIKEVEGQLHQKIQSISSVAEQSNTTNANKILLRKWINNTLAQQKLSIEQSQLSFEQRQQGLIVKQLQSARLLIEMKDGKPVKCFELPIEQATGSIPNG